MSQTDKLFADILDENKNLRFADLCKALELCGYQKKQPSNGSSHYTYRKKDCYPITIPKQQPMHRVYISVVSDVVRAYLQENN